MLGEVELLPDCVEFVFAMDGDVFEGEHLVTGFEFVEAGFALAFYKRQALIVVKLRSCRAAGDS